MPPIYLDHNATTPIAPTVADAMQPYLRQHFGNPSSSHWYGAQTKKAVESARAQIASLLGCHADEIVITSGGSESNNFAIKSAYQTWKQQGNHIITSAIEHPAVINVCQFLADEYGCEITYLPVDQTGLIDPAALRAAMRPDTILITIMHANNEVGTIQPIAELAQIAQEHKILFHTDAAQSIGKIPAKVTELGVDMLSLAGHKLYAPKGIGALFIKRGLKLKAMIHGASHEGGRRAGTENVLEIVGLGAACALAEKQFDNQRSHAQKLRDRLWKGLKKQIPNLVLNGHPQKRLPNTLSVSFPGIDANTLLSELDEIAASPGAACHDDVFEPSDVLTAMKVPRDLALGTIRFSTGRLNDQAQIEKATQLISAAVKRLQADNPPTQEITDATTVKLTHYTHGLGCACKLRPQNLEKILADLPVPRDPAVLVDTTHADDAAVYKISDTIALVQTVDFFTPVVDDPYHFGAIAAANSLSDIYAMGAAPLFALNIVGFPEKRLPLSVLKEILKGAADKAAEAGIFILGGHTVEDSEPKFGLAVTGQVHPTKILTNSQAQPGDILILTKPIGLGILTTGLKRGLLDSATSKKIIEIMSLLNKNAAKAMENFPVHACTDVTGFGLLGHLKEMTVASKVEAEIFAASVPLIPEAMELAQANQIPGGTQANFEYITPYVRWDNEIPHSTQMLLCDAQTSGGLLIAIPADLSRQFIQQLQQEKVSPAAVIGKITAPGQGTIWVRP